jgi:hypothetical protein
MQLDVDDLRKHYASLSDDALLALERDELTDVARRCYDDEVAKRRISPEQDAEPPPDQCEPEVEEDWLEGATSACSFGPQDRSDLEEACAILGDAEIPYHVNEREEVSQSGRPYVTHEVMVPSGLALLATSVLDKEFFNPRQEVDWRTHFEMLSDDEFRVINIEDLTAGMVDRVERLTRVYASERDRRG